LTSCACLAVKSFLSARTFSGSGTMKSAHVGSAAAVVVPVDPDGVGVGVSDVVLVPAGWLVRSSGLHRSHWDPYFFRSSARNCSTSVFTAVLKTASTKGSAMTTPKRKAIPIRTAIIGTLRQKLLDSGADTSHRSKFRISTN